MKKFKRKKLAFALAFASILSGGTQARNKNEAQSQQTLATVVGVSDKNLNKGFVNWVKDHRLVVGIGSTLTVATAAALTILGFKCFGKKNKDNNNIDEISNNPKKDNNTDVENQKMDSKINLNQENIKVMSYEEAVKNFVEKLTEVLKLNDTYLKDKELENFNKRIELSLTIILKHKNEILNLFPVDKPQMSRRFRYRFQQFIDCLKTGRIMFQVCGHSTNFLNINIKFEPDKAHCNNDPNVTLNLDKIIMIQHSKWRDRSCINFSNNYCNFFEFSYYHNANDDDNDIYKIGDESYNCKTNEKIVKQTSKPGKIFE